MQVTSLSAFGLSDCLTIDCRSWIMQEAHKVASSVTGTPSTTGDDRPVQDSMTPTARVASVSERQKRVGTVAILDVSGLPRMVLTA